MEKITITMRVAVHPLKAKLWKVGTSGQIESSMSLRDIGRLVGESAPQKIKHHLEAMVTMGAIDKRGGQYVFPKI